MKALILTALTALGLVTTPAKPVKPITEPTKTTSPTATAKSKMPVKSQVTKIKPATKPTTAKKTVPGVKKASDLKVPASKIIEIALPLPKKNKTTPAKDRDISNPEPFTMSENEISKSPLTVAGVLAFTNAARHDNGDITALKGNALLNKVAGLRLKDMFDKQYFAHVSPSGIGPSEIAGDVGYEYLTLGENIARGTFADDAALVTAWMNSPHHRENIVNPKYQELGIAVGEGTYEGHSTWLAVQVFGTAASVCPEPDETLKTSINAASGEVNTLAESAAKIQSELEKLSPKTSLEIENYNVKINEYNDLAQKITALNESIKLKIKTYNGQSNSYNKCING